MRPRKYPLDPLARLRVKQVGDATKLLSDAIRARHKAERVEEAALARRDIAVDEARSIVEREQGALERGELRAADLALVAAWRVRADLERADLERRLARATERTGVAQENAENAQGKVARARADAEVVARDRAKWEGAERKKDEAAEEEAGAEAFRGKPT